MLKYRRFLAFFGLLLLLPIALFADEHTRNAKDSYDVLLHSRSLVDQRDAVRVILDRERFIDMPPNLDRKQNVQVRFVSPWKRCLICVGKAQLAKARSQTHLISAYRTLTMGF
jgi:hypothetical protein